MKDNLKALIVLASLVPLPALAEISMYGRANVSLQSADEGDDSTVELVSNASRLGIKGSEPIAEGLEAIYQAEFEVAFDDGDNKGRTLSQRNVFVGLKGNFGSVIGGHFDTPLKRSQHKVDLFNDLEGDIRSLITRNDNRESNSVMYVSPSLSGVTVYGAFIASEEENVADGKSIAAAYTLDNLYLALGMDQDVEAEDTKALRLVTQYEIANWLVGGLYEDFEDVAGESYDGWMVSALYQWQNWGYKAQYGRSDILVTGGKTFSLGADYLFSKTAKAFAYYTQERWDSEVDPDNSENQYVGVGFELNF